MFNNYVEFISRSVENLFGTTISFNGYFSSVIGAIVLILGAILLLGGNALIFQLPVYVKHNLLYGKEYRNHLKEIKRLDLEGLDYNEYQKRWDLKHIIKRKKKRTIFFILGLIVLYIPIALPIIITILDVAKNINIILFMLQIIVIVISFLISLGRMFAVNDDAFTEWVVDNIPLIFLLLVPLILIAGPIGRIILSI